MNNLKKYFSVFFHYLLQWYLIIEWIFHKYLGFVQLINLFFWQNENGTEEGPRKGQAGTQARHDGGGWVSEGSDKKTDWLFIWCFCPSRKFSISKGRRRSTLPVTGGNLWPLLGTQGHGIVNLGGPVLYKHLVEHLSVELSVANEARTLSEVNALPTEPRRRFFLFNNRSIHYFQKFMDL